MYVEDTVKDQIRLTTLKTLKESIVEEHIVVKESIKGNDDDKEKISTTEEDGATNVAENI